MNRRRYHTRLLAFNIAINGNTIAVGDADPGSVSKSPGAVYLFFRPVNGWKSASQPNAKLVANDGHNRRRLRPTRSISGKT